MIGAVRNADEAGDEAGHDPSQQHDEAHRDAHQIGGLRVVGHRAHGDSLLGLGEEPPEDRADHQGDGHVVEVAFADQRPPDFHRGWIEGDRERLGVAAPQPTGNAMQYVVDPKGGGEQGQPVRIRNRTHDHAFHQHAEADAADHNHWQHQIVIEIEFLDEDDAEEGRDHRKIALGEIDGSGVSEDDNHGNGRQGIEAAGCESAHKLLSKHVMYSLFPQPVQANARE